MLGAAQAACWAANGGPLVGKTAVRSWAVVGAPGVRGWAGLVAVFALDHSGLKGAGSQARPGPGGAPRSLVAPLVSGREVSAMNRRIFYWVASPATAVQVTLATGSVASAAGSSFLAVNTLPVIIDNIVAWFIGLLWGIATLFLTIAMVRYLAAGGRMAEVEKAKDAFKNALFGYAGAILAPVLLDIVRAWIGA